MNLEDTPRLNFLVCEMLWLDAKTLSVPILGFRSRGAGVLNVACVGASWVQAA